MQANQPLSAQRRVRSFIALCVGLAALVLAAAADERQGQLAPPAENDSAAPPPIARLVPVELPISGDSDRRLIRAINKLLQDFPAATDGSRPVLVLEFQAKVDEDGRTTEFERALSLARFLASPKLSHVRTIAYLPHSLRGHAVLPALACEQLVLHADAELGEAGLEADLVDSTMESAYRDIASRRRTVPVPVAMGMLKKELAVYRVSTLEGTRYVLGDELKQLQQEATVESVDTLSPPGDLVRLSGTDMRLKYGFPSQLAADREQLASVLRVPRESLVDDPSLAEQWAPVRLDVQGVITDGSATQVERLLRKGMPKGANFLLVVLDTPGGSPADSVRIANLLADYDPAEMRTVALINRQARGDATLIAMACDQVVMIENGILGGPGDQYLTRSDLNDLRVPLQQIGTAQQRDWSGWLGLIDPELEVHLYEKEGTAERRLFSGDEVPESGDWKKGDKLELAKGLLPSEAQKFGLVQDMVSQEGEIQTLFNLPSPPRALQPSWAESALERLAAQPWFSRTLLFIAFFALISESSAPGIGVAGFVSGLCFLLFFWAQFLSGNAGWLELLLFTGGVVCVGLELFAIPGVGIFGIGGGLMIIVSIVLASQTFIVPRNSYQLDQLAGSLFMVVCGGAGAATAIAVVRKVLPNAPFLRRLMLLPPSDEQQAVLEKRESLVDWDYLEGKRGETTTRLAPSGKARFGDDVVDVISHGALIPRGTPVRVVEVRGNHVLVEEIS